MSLKMSADDLAAYMEATMNLLDNLSKDLEQNDGLVSQDTVEALDVLIETTALIEDVYQQLKSEKRVLN